MSEPGVTLVVAGNRDQFLDWCRDHEVQLDRLAVYAAYPDAVRGFRIARVVFCGTWNERDDIGAIEAAATPRLLDGARFWEDTDE